MELAEYWDSYLDDLTVNNLSEDEDNEWNEDNHQEEEESPADEASA